MRPDNHLETRRRHLERRTRLIFAASIAIAAMVHVAVFAANPSGEVEIGSVANPTQMDFRLGEPRDVVIDGATLDRDARLVAFAANEATLRVALARDGDMRRYRIAGEAGVVAVSVTVDASGRVRAAELVEGTGDETFDGVFKRLVAKLQLTLIPEPTTGATFTLPISIGPIGRVLR